MRPIPLFLALSACSLDVSGTSDAGIVGVPGDCVELLAPDAGGAITCSQVTASGEAPDAAINVAFLLCQTNGCDGCCSLGGQCLPGAEDVQCGQHGWRCVDCTTYTATCEGDGMCHAK